MSLEVHSFISLNLNMIVLIDATAYDEEIKRKQKYLYKYIFNNIQQKHSCPL